MRYAKMLVVIGLGLFSAQAAGDEAGLDWLAGHWCGGQAGDQIEEMWLPQAGGALLGMSRTVRDERMESFEFMRVVPEGKDAGFHVQPNGVPPTVFAISAHGKGWVRFENPAHDFPKRIEYRREGERLHAWIAGPGRDGKEKKIPFEYRRCAG